MKRSGNTFELNANDLVGLLNWHHLAALDRAVAEGALCNAGVWDPFLQILSERGSAHEQERCKCNRRSESRTSRHTGGSHYR